MKKTNSSDPLLLHKVLKLKKSPCGRNVILCILAGHLVKISKLAG